MGWSSGSSLFAEIAEILVAHVSDDDEREAAYGEIIDAFEARDCDTLHECIGIDPVLDELLEDMGLGDEEDEED